MANKFFTDKEHVEHLQNRITDLELRLAAAGQRAKKAEAENKVMHRYAREELHQEVWHWQGDEYDHPESLSCPVIMDCQVLRDWLEERAADKKRLEAAENVLQMLKENNYGLNWKIMRALDRYDATKLAEAEAKEAGDA